MDVFEFDDYKQFLRHQIAQHSPIRGYQSKLADSAGCQKSYFSQVLNYDSHFTPEQAIRLGQFWEMDSAEIDWFLEIVNLARTQYEPLKKRIRDRLAVMKANRQNLATRSKRPKIQSIERQSLYYSSWYWSAIHIISSIPAYRKPEAIAERFNLPQETVKATLVKLKNLGLVSNNGNEWRIVPGGLHLPKESIFAATHHSNWRQKAVMDAHQPDEDSLHYTDVVSHSFADLHRLKALLLKTVDEWRAGVRRSKEEEISCLCLDFFRL